MLNAIWDLIVSTSPWWPNNREYKFVFLVHPRDTTDIRKKFPILKGLSNKSIEFLMFWFWPVTVSHISGLKSQLTGMSIQGIVISIPMTAKQMLEHRSIALKKIHKALKLSERYGGKIVGLGGLTSSITKGGELLIEKTKMSITTGHAYTAYNVTQNFFKVSQLLSIDQSKCRIAIVGAAGSIGSTSALILAANKVKNILLIDVERKHDAFPVLIEKLKELFPEINISTSSHISDIKDADIILSATNSPEALIQAADLKRGAIIIDDAQPTDVADDVFERNDVLVLAAGSVFTPGIRTHFDMGLKGKFDNYCCMAEVLTLASLEWKEHFVIHRANLELVDEIVNKSLPLGFTISAFQNSRGHITPEQLINIKHAIDPTIISR